MDHSFIPAVEPPEPSDPVDRAFWFVFRGSELLILNDDLGVARIPELLDPIEIALAPIRRNYLGTLTGRPIFAIEVSADIELPSGLIAQGLRALYGRLSDEHFAIAGRAAQIIEWDRTHQFCGRCGMPTEYARGERAKRCPNCQLISFPRLSPAIIVLIERGDEVLLARGHNFAEGVYSTLAGFVEPGESLEGAVHREIYEESGIELTDVRYFGSQPWPFPHSLMIGFTAQYAGGEITIDPKEIADARWFTYATLPRVPQKMSIARRLIDSYVEKHGPPLEQP